MLRGENGRVVSRVNFDGLHLASDGRLSILEVLGGGALQNNRLMKDLFEALIVPGVGHVAIAVPQQVHGGRPYDYTRYLTTEIFARGIQQCTCRACWSSATDRAAASAVHRRRAAHAQFNGSCSFAG